MKADVYIAFIGHPPTADYVGNFFEYATGKIPIIRKFKAGIGEWATRSFDGNKVKNNLAEKVARYICFKGPLPIDVCRVPYGEETEQILEERIYSLPFTTAQILNPDNIGIVQKEALKIIKLVERQGAMIVGLGAAMKSSRVFDSGDYFVGKTSLPISNGNNYTIASCIDVALAACNKMEINLEDSVVAVVGANGSIGRICCEMISQHSSHLILFGNPSSGTERLEERAEIAKEHIKRIYGRNPEIEVSIELKEDLQKADLVLSATDSPRPVIGPEMLKSGAVVVDIARPHDTKRSDKERFIEKGCLVTDGGIVYHEGHIHLKSLKLPKNAILACAAEPAVLGISYKRGQLSELSDWVETNIENVEMVKRLAENNGFSVETETFRFHYEPIPNKTIERILLNSTDVIG